MERMYRRLHAADIGIALSLNERFRPGFVGEEAARAFLQNRQNWLFACLEGEVVLGFVYGYELCRLNGEGPMLYIHEVGVHEQFHRQGIGRQMMTHLQTLCRLGGICRMFLFAQRSNAPACALYDALGGEEAHPDDVVYFFQTR